MKNRTTTATFTRIAFHIRACLGLLLTALPLAAHGANFPPPPATPPWNGPTGDGGPTRGPRSPGGGSTGPASPLPPGSTSPGPSSPGSPGGSAAASSPGAEGLDFASWHLWWEFNKEPFLALKEHLYTTEIQSGTGGFYLGDGVEPQGEAPARFQRPSAEDVRERIAPALEKALAVADSNDMTTACLVALAKLGGEGAEGARLADLFLPYLQDPNQEVAETAAAALGILGHEASAFRLGELAENTDRGARLVDAKRVSVRTRAFAAYGLGLIGARSDRLDVRRFVVHKLLRVALADDTSTPDLGVACMIGAGLVPLPWSGNVPQDDQQRSLPATTSREAQITVLLDLLSDKKTDRIVRAHVAGAIGNLLAYERSGSELSATLRASQARMKEQAADVLLDALREKGSFTREVAQSAALALGRIADGDADRLDQRIRAELARSGTDANDRVTRFFALLALVEAAPRVGDGDRREVTDVRALLLKGLARGDGETRRQCALALGLLERRLGELGTVPARDATNALRRCLTEAKDPNDVGAYAIASGIARAPEAANELIQSLADQRDDRALGYVAIGLGLLEVHTAREPVLELVDGATYRPGLLREAATALGLLGDRKAVDVLLAKLHKASSLASQASLAQAVGRIGDAGAIEPLVGMLGDRSLTSRARAFAAVALGSVADKDPLPWNSRLSVGLNYAAAPATLFDLAGFGILNIL